MRSPARRSPPPSSPPPDRYALYGRAVQAPEHEARFFARVYRAGYGRPPLLLREDFCGAAAICAAWVRGGGSRRAYGVDLDPEPLTWARGHTLAALRPAQRERIELAEHDACAVRGPKADVVAAMNFSFFLFKTRGALRGYFAAAHANLADRGVLVLDVMGGWETLQEGKRDTRRIPAVTRARGGPGESASGGDEGFTYIWEQARFDPITHDATFHIHFRLRDGRELRRAFTYEWRLWTLPEIRELLLETGFTRADVYWEGTDQETGQGDGVWRRREHAASDPAWIACVVGVK